MFLAASVALQQDLYSAEEGGEVQVCAVISNVPAGGLECPVVANLSASDGNAGKWLRFLLRSTYLMYIHVI